MSLLYRQSQPGDLLSQMSFLASASTLPEPEPIRPMTMVMCANEIKFSSLGRPVPVEPSATLPGLADFTMAVGRDVQVRGLGGMVWNEGLEKGLFFTGGWAVYVACMCVEGRRHPCRVCVGNTPGNLGVWVNEEERGRITLYMKYKYHMSCVLSCRASASVIKFNWKRVCTFCGRVHICVTVSLTARSSPLAPSCQPLR